MTPMMWVTITTNDTTTVAYFTVTLQGIRHEVTLTLMATLLGAW